MPDNRHLWRKPSEDSDFALPHLQLAGRHIYRLKPTPLNFSIATVTPPNFPEIAGFSEAIEALRYALLELGHEANLTGASLLERTDNILYGAHLLPANVQLYPHTILVNLEPLENNPILPARYLERLRQHVVWDYSLINVRHLRSLGFERVFHLPMGYVPQQRRIRRTTPDIDVLFYGVLNPRRRKVLQELSDAGAKVTHLAGVYGNERDSDIARSRIVLNMRFRDHGILETVRVLYLLTNGCFVISEPGEHEEENRRFSGGMVFTEYQHLTASCLHYLSNDTAREAIAARATAVAKACPQAGYLAPVLDAMRAAQALRTSTDNPI